MQARNDITLEVGQTIHVNHRPVFSTVEGPEWAAAIVMELFEGKFKAQVIGDGAIVTRPFDGYGMTWKA